MDVTLAATILCVTLLSKESLAKVALILDLIWRRRQRRLVSLAHNGSVSRPTSLPFGFAATFVRLPFIISRSLFLEGKFSLCELDTSKFTGQIKGSQTVGWLTKERHCDCATICPLNARAQFHSPRLGSFFGPELIAFFSSFASPSSHQGGAATAAAFFHSRQKPLKCGTS